MALIRGINVGGNNLIKMSDLKRRLQEAGLKDVETYIQSGNILFSSEETDARKLAELISRSIRTHFGTEVGVAVRSHSEYREIIEKAPQAWGKDPEWKHNLFVLIDPADREEIMTALGDLKPALETVVCGDGVIYQSMTIDQYGKTSSSKLPSKPAYKKITVRNYNTSVKLLQLLNKES